jgi:hypothetical protein
MTESKLTIGQSVRILKTANTGRIMAVFIPFKGEPRYCVAAQVQRKHTPLHKLVIENIRQHLHGDDSEFLEGLERASGEQMVLAEHWFNAEELEPIVSDVFEVRS